MGFIIVGATIYLLVNLNQKFNFNEKLLLGIIGTISTILSNLVGGIYLKMYSETVKSLTEFHHRLVVTHHLHFSNFLISKITDKELREKTLMDLVIKIAEKQITFDS